MPNAVNWGLALGTSAYIPLFGWFCSWRCTGAPVLDISAWHQWWTSVHDSLQLWLWTTCFDGGTDERTDIPRGSSI